MTKKYSWTFWRHLVFSFIIVGASFISEVIVASVFGVNLLSRLIAVIETSSISNAPSIGIIGGSDGPTAIYLGNNISPIIFVISQGILFLILLMLYIPIKLYIKRIMTEKHELDGK